MVIEVGEMSFGPELAENVTQVLQLTFSYYQKVCRLIHFLYWHSMILKNNFKLDVRGKKKTHIDHY